MTSERSNRVVACFNAELSCSQAICPACGDEFGLSPSDAARVAAGVRRQGTDRPDLRGGTGA